MAGFLQLACDAPTFHRQLDAVGRAQLPFALALTLTRTAEESVAAIKQGLGSHFILRRKWIAKGFRVDRATKQQLTATIRHLDAFMALQEFGGTKTAGATGVVAVPIGARPDPMAVTPPSRWPGRIPRRYFVDVGGERLEFARRGRRARVHKAPGLGTKHGFASPAATGGRARSDVLMYLLRPSVQIRPRLGAVLTTRDTIAARLGVNFDGFLAYSIATAR